MSQACYSTSFIAVLNDSPEDALGYRIMNADYQRCRSWSQPIKSFCYSFTQGAHDWCASVRVSRREASSAVPAAPLSRLRMSSRELQRTPTMSLSVEGLPDHKIRSLRVGFCRKQWTKRPCLLRDTLLEPLLIAFHTRLHRAQGSARRCSGLLEASW